MPVPVPAFEAVEIINEAGSAPILLCCEHASNHVPDGIRLGVTDADLETHIGHDIGAADVTRRLSELLDAPAVLSHCSRLVIDCNRPLASAESIPAEVAGIPIPGNHRLPDSERQRRAAHYFEPFHASVESLLTQRDPNATHLLVSIHSFTPRLLDEVRPWDVGVLQRRSPAAGEAMVKAFRETGVTCAANQPYQIEDETDATIPRHGEAQGRSAVLIELRQDGLATQAEIEIWAQRTAAAIRAAVTGMGAR